MIKVYELARDMRVQLSCASVPLSVAVEREVEAVWSGELKRRGSSLYNGKILSVDQVLGDLVSCSLTEYRRLAVQRLRPEMFCDLNVRALAVSGMLFCKDGLVIGLRSSRNTQDQGLWELVPSGGIDPDSRGVTDAWSAVCEEPKAFVSVDYLAQLKDELREEVGIDWSHIGSYETICLVEDLVEHVIDIVIRLNAPNLTISDIQNTHSRSGSAEYSRLTVLPTGVQANLELSLFYDLTPVSQFLLERYPLAAVEPSG